MNSQPNRLASISGTNSPDGSEMLLTFKGADGSEQRYLVSTDGMPEVIAAMEAHYQRAAAQRGTSDKNTNAMPPTRHRLKRSSGGMTKDGLPLLALDLERRGHVEIALDLQAIRDLAKILGVLEKAITNRAQPTTKPN